MPIRGSEVSRTKEFAVTVDRLRTTFPKIDEIVDEFSELLQCGFALPDIPLGSVSRHVYVRRLDYPPAGSQGRGVLRVIYFASDPQPSPSTPYQTIELLTIDEVDGQSDA